MKEGSSYKWIVLGNIMIGTFMAVLVSTAIIIGMPVVVGALAVVLNAAAWVLTGYLRSMASGLTAPGSVAAWLGLLLS